MEQRLVFGQVADLYERLRPGYPEALVDTVIERSGVGSDSRILEIGCGTGKATRLLAGRGLAVLAIEPDPAMAAVARRVLAGNARVEILETDLESARLDAGAFDLVAAAQALHWVAPGVRFDAPARLLRAGGWLAFFGNRPVPDGSPLRREIDEAYARFAPHMDARTPGSARTVKAPLVEELAAHPAFEPEQRFGFPWSQELSRDDYLDLLRTQSDHRMLPAARLEELLSAIGEAIDRQGGRIPIQWNAVLSMARRS